MEAVGFDANTARLTIFLSFLIGMSALEVFIPRKTRVAKRANRWLTNIGFALINTVALRFLVPVAAVGAALWAQKNSFGIFNVLNIPMTLTIVAAIIILDLALYWQHVATHKIPLFWRFHKVHHADRDLDATSGIRFHPVEICISMVFKMAIVTLIGAPLIAVVIFEIILNACALFNHANVRLPLWLDRVLRIFIVTPDYHRVHHSVIETETNSNYGFSLTLWDHLFKSYQAQPSAGHDGMTIGLSEYQDTGPQRLSWSLTLPFK